MGRRAGGTGRQRTIPRPPDVTAAPARTREFMFPAALANRPANKTGHGRSVRIGHGCVDMRHTRSAETSSTAAMSVLGFCPERRKPEIVRGRCPLPLARKAARRSADQVRAPHYCSRRSSPQRRTRCAHRTAAPAHSTRTSTTGARQAAAAYPARGDECRARGLSRPGRYTAARTQSPSKTSRPSSAP